MKYLYPLQLETTVNEGGAMAAAGNAMKPPARVVAAITATRPRRIDAIINRLKFETWNVNDTKDSL
jgi:hypothetical protein